MICDTCHGCGEVLIDHDGNVVARLAGAMLLAPCPDCIGGISSCCDAAGSRDAWEDVQYKLSQRDRVLRGGEP